MHDGESTAKSREPPVAPALHSCEEVGGKVYAPSECSVAPILGKNHYHTTRPWNSTAVTSVSLSIFYVYLQDLDLKKQLVTLQA